MFCFFVVRATRIANRETIPRTQDCLREEGRAGKETEGEGTLVQTEETFVMFIVLYACLISAPATCREERINVSMEATAPTACIMSSQFTIAQWSEEHPQWQVGRWKCVPSNRLFRDI